MSYDDFLASKSFDDFILKTMITPAWRGIPSTTMELTTKDKEKDMAQVRMCDRCGGIVKAKEVTGTTVSEYVDGKYGNDTKRNEYELCSACTAEVKAFIENPPARE